MNEACVSNELEVRVLEELRAHGINTAVYNNECIQSVNVLSVGGGVYILA